VRPPVKAQLTICREAYRPEAKTPSCSSPPFYKAEPDAAPQFGQLRFLPFRNGPFEANQLAVELREDGSIEKFEYKNTKAAAAGLTAAVADAVNQYKTFRDAQDTKAQSAAEAARKEEIAKIQYEIDVLTKQKERLKLNTPDAPDALEAIRKETTRIETETALLNARLAQLKAEASIAEASGV
jgi:hypothetical protein